MLGTTSRKTAYMIKKIAGCAAVGAMMITGPVPVFITEAEAHSGAHPFEDCTAAYEAGASNISANDIHYQEKLDRDGDGVGCDNPGADFTPKDWKHKEESERGGEKEPDDTELAQTGGDSATPYVAGIGGAVVLAGGALVMMNRRRRTTN